MPRKLEAIASSNDADSGGREPNSGPPFLARAAHSPGEFGFVLLQLV